MAGDVSPVPRTHFGFAATIIVVAIAMAASGIIVGLALANDDAQALGDATQPVEAIVVVNERKVAEDVTISGIGSAGDAINVAATPIDGAERLVVTSVGIGQGDSLASGTPLLVVSGRPLFLLKIVSVPYRNLVFGDRGEDVAALQRALRDLGYPASKTGRFDDLTSSAIGDFYRDRGVLAPKSAGRAMFVLDEFATYSHGEPVVASVAARNEVVEVGDILVSLRTEANVVVARADLVEAESFALGGKVTVLGPAGAYDGKVSSLSNFQEGSADQKSGVDVTVALGADATIAPDMPYTVTVTGNETSGPAVPLGALREEGAGYYVVRDVNGLRTNVPVSVVTSAEGFAVLAGDGQVHVGDHVVVD